MTSFIVRNKRDGQLVELGDQVVSFLGESATLIAALRTQSPGKDGKVQVQWADEHSPCPVLYYAGVFDLEVKEAE